jgi:hypothetical protein
MKTGYKYKSHIGSVSGNIYAPYIPKLYRDFDRPGCYTWKKVFHIIPVKTIKGKWVWWQDVYEQRFWTVSYMSEEPEVEYAELFDILSLKYTVDN